MIGQQTTGVNAFLGYAATLFKQILCCKDLSDVHDVHDDVKCAVPLSPESYTCSWPCLLSMFSICF